MSNKVVSIIIPAYNMEKYIQKNLDSIVSAKNLIDVEIIIVNDGSTDSTLSICRQYKDRYDDIIKIINKENGHYGSCINAALEAATGKYFRILDADDWFGESSLDIFIEKLRNCDADLVVTLRCEVRIDKNGIENKMYIPIKGIDYGRVYDAQIFRISDYSEGVEFNMHSMTYKTAILRETGLRLPEGICYTDMIYCLVPISRIKSLVAYDIYLYHYRKEREGSSTSNNVLRRNLVHITKVMDFMMRYIRENPAATDAVHANQMRFLKEATAFFISIVKKQRFVGKTEFTLFPAIIDGLKELNVNDRTFRKYYFRYWYNRKSRLLLNISIVIYKLFHPLK